MILKLPTIIATSIRSPLAFLPRRNMYSSISSRGSGGSRAGAAVLTGQEQGQQDSRAASGVAGKQQGNSKFNSISSSRGSSRFSSSDRDSSGSSSSSSNGAAASNQIFELFKLFIAPSSLLVKLVLSFGRGVFDAAHSFCGADHVGPWRLPSSHIGTCEAGRLPLPVGSPLLLEWLRPTCVVLRI